MSYYSEKETDSKGKRILYEIFRDAHMRGATMSRAHVHTYHELIYIIDGEVTVVLNNSDVDINLSVTIAPTTTALNPKFTVTQSLAGGEHEIKAGQTKEIVVTVKLNEDVTAAVDPITYVIEYTATAA